MSNAVDLPTDSSTGEDAHSPWPARIGWGLFGVAYLIFASLTVATIQSGLHDKELDGDGVVGEVIFPDADAVTGVAGAPFGAGLGQSGDMDPGRAMAGARAHNRWLAELCSHSPERRAGVAVIPILADIDAAVA